MNAESQIAKPATSSDSASTSVQMLTIIKQAAQSPDVDVAKMQALLNLQRDLIHDQAVAEFNAAYGRLVLKLPRIKKDGSVEYEDNKGKKKKAFDYATYEAIDDIVRPLLLEEGFSLSFDSTPREGGGLIVTGTLLHSAGHERKAAIPVPLDTSGGKNNIQGMGSAFSYGKRYTTTMLLNIVTEGEDDDGNRAGMEFIDLKCCKHINELLAETGADINAFLKYMEASEVANIQKKDYAMAINALLAKRRPLVKADPQSPEANENS